jgi:hypothetical protein
MHNLTTSGSWGRAGCSDHYTNLAKQEEASNFDKRKRNEELSVGELMPFLSAIAFHFCSPVPALFAALTALCIKTKCSCQRQGRIASIPQQENCKSTIVMSLKHMPLACRCRCKSVSNKYLSRFLMARHPN